METVRFREQPQYQPGGHHGVLNRLLVGRTLGGVESVSIWHGTLDAGGGADVHTHPESVQVYVLVTGVVTVTGGDESTNLEPGDAVIIPAGEPHGLHNPGGEPATLYVVSSPALR